MIFAITFISSRILVPLSVGCGCCQFLLCCLEPDMFWGYVLVLQFA